MKNEKTQSPKISVIIPVYNGEKTIKECLLSVINQTYKNYEVIVIDNNSTDETKSVILELQRNSKKIQYLFEKNRGRGSARNAGVNASKGKIIAMTDSDCMVPKNWIEELTREIRSNKESAVLGSETEAFKNYWTKMIQKANSDFLKSTLRGDYAGHIDTKNFAIKSEILKNNLFDPALKATEDFELYLRLKKIVKIKFDSKVKVKHFHKTSLRGFFKSNFERGHYAYLIYQIHKKDNKIKKEQMMQAMYLRNILKYPARILKKFTEKPLGESVFLLISGLSWELGNIYGLIKYRML